MSTLTSKLFKIFFLSRFILHRNSDIIKKSISVHVIEKEQEKVVRYEGIYGKTLPYQIKRHLGVKKVPETRILEFTDAKIIGPKMVVCVDGKYLPPENIDSEKKHTQQIYREFGLTGLLNESKKKPDCEIDHAFLVAGGFRGQGYPKMYIEVLPKMRWYEKYCHETDEKPVLLFPGMPDAQKRLLKHFGYGDGDFREITDYVHIHCKRLLVPTAPIRTWNGDNAYNPSDLRWVVDTIKKGVLQEDRSSTFDREHTLIYVGRSNTKKRIVANEDEVIKTLQKLGFTWFDDPGTLPLEEQIRLFSKARIIVGAHGSGLSNMIFASNAVVIEFHSGEEGVVGHYFVTANDMNLKYDFLVCRSNSELRHKWSERHQNLTIDTVQLENVVRHYLNEVRE